MGADAAKVASIFVALAGQDRFRQLGADPPDEVNLWQPSRAGAFRTPSAGELFLFEPHAPQGFVVGGGAFKRFAARRPWPAITVPAPPTRMGLSKPKRLVGSAMRATCLGSCLRALRGSGLGGVRAQALEADAATVVEGVGRILQGETDAVRRPLWG